jgi:hypothetical protein
MIGTNNIEFSLKRFNNACSTNEMINTLGQRVAELSVRKPIAVVDKPHKIFTHAEVMRIQIDAIKETSSK